MMNEYHFEYIAIYIILVIFLKKKIESNIELSIFFNYLFCYINFLIKMDKKNFKNKSLCTKAKFDEPNNLIESGKFPITKSPRIKRGVIWSTST